MDCCSGPTDDLWYPMLSESNRCRNYLGLPQFVLLVDIGDQRRD
jgi:hypothetical protein